MLVSSLIKHLDHKNVTKQQGIQVNMVKVATCLVVQAKQGASGAMTAVIAELIKHLRKCLQNAAESDLSANETKQNSELQHALENCIAELSKKVSWNLFSSLELSLHTQPHNCFLFCFGLRLGMQGLFLICWRWFLRLYPPMYTLLGPQHQPFSVLHL